MVIEENKYREVEEAIISELHEYVTTWVTEDKEKGKALNEIILKAFRQGVVLASREHHTLKEEISGLMKQHEDYRVNSQAVLEETAAMKERLKRVLKFIIEEL